MVSSWSRDRCPFRASCGPRWALNFRRRRWRTPGEALVEYRIANRDAATRTGALVLAVRPVQVNPYWQHGGHAMIDAIAVDGCQLRVNDRIYAKFAAEPDAVAIADFDGGDVIRLIETGPQQTARSLRSASGLLSAACEFDFSLAPGEIVAFVMSSPMRDGVTPNAERVFSAVRDDVVRRWREKLGPRRITVGDNEVSDTLEAQTALILVNATRTAFKPGPRNYDRIWIRDGSSQALALLWAGLAEEAKAYVIWYSERIYESGLVPPILNMDGVINRGYGSDIEFDAQGEFVGIAADIYRISRDRAFLNTIFEPVVRATRFIEELCARTNALHGPDTRFHGLLAPSISHEGYSKPSYSYWDDYFALSALRNCEYVALEIGDMVVAADARAKGQAFAANLARSLRLTAEEDGRGPIPASADREDVDPSSTSIAFEPCRVEDVLPAELISATFDLSSARIKQVAAPGFSPETSPPTRYATSTPWCRSVDSMTHFGCSPPRLPAGDRWAGDIGLRLSGARRDRPSMSATCRTPGSEPSSPLQFDECYSAKTAARSNFSGPCPTAGGKGKASGCAICRRASVSPI